MTEKQNLNKAEDKQLKQVENEEKKLEKELIEAQEKLADYTETLQRLQAEFENYKKRVDKERTKLLEFANAHLISDFLSIIDSFENAIQVVEKTEKYSKEDAVKGLKLLFQQTLDLMKRHGLKEIKSEGEKFNPEFHEAVLQESIAEKPDFLVLQEFQKGYLLNGKVLRHSKVLVNKHPEEKHEGLEKNVKEKK